MLKQVLFIRNTASHQRLALAVILAALACLLYACQNRTDLDLPGSGPVAGAALPSPAQLLALLDAHSASAAGQTKPGALYESTLPNNLVAINGTALDFTPSWDQAGSHLFSDLAYAMYLFDGTGLSGSSAVTSAWTALPMPGNGWIGLADFSKNRWDWFSSGSTAPLSIPDLAPYIDPGDSRIIVAYVVIGTAPATLDSVTLGEAVPEIPLPVVPLAPIPMGGTGLAGPVLADGNPALAYIEDVGGTGSAWRLIFIRATDSDGATWGASVTIADNIMSSPGLAVIGGNPAVAYQSQIGTLMYCRATDAQGSSWGTPVEVDAATPGAGTVAELLDIGGRPAIAYLGSSTGPSSGQPALYIRADDATGSSWSDTPMVLNPEYSSGDSAVYFSFAVIAGNPAVAYNWVNTTNAAGLRYVRASDATGSAWSTPADVTGAGYEAGTLMLRNVDLADLGGLPGIVYFIEDFGVEADSAAYFSDAQDAAGATWDPKQTVLVAPPGEDPVTFGSLHVLTKQDGTQRAIAVAPRGGFGIEYNNDFADVFVATIPGGGGADFSTGVKHMIARYGSGKGPSVLRSASCYGSIDGFFLLLAIAILGGEEYVKMSAAQLGYDDKANKMGVSTSHATLPGSGF